MGAICCSQAPETIPDVDVTGNRNRIQYIAYELCTMPHGFNTRNTTADDWYVGREDIPQDIASRVALLGQALQRAAADPNIDKSSSTLKVFMAPDFFFRGPKGAYALKHVLGVPDSAGSLEGQLASLVLDTKWENWICVFGTVVGYKSLDSLGNNVVYNISIIQEGGCGSLTAAAAKSTAVIKTNKSGIDFLGDPKFGGLADGDVRHVLNPVSKLEVKGDRDALDIDDDGIFAMRGITFGLEICLDHAVQKLKNTPQKVNENRMQVQLVPSGGMTVQSESICVQPDGLVFHCDGLTNGKRAYGAHSSAFILSGGTLRPQTPMVQLSAHGTNWKAALEKLYDTSVDAEPRISIYPPCDIPALGCS